MTTHTQPTRIVPDAIYDDLSASLALSLSESSLARGRRDGSLRFAKRGYKNLYFGRWLVAWLEGAGDESTLDGQLSTAQP